MRQAGEGGQGRGRLCQFVGEIVEHLCRLIGPRRLRVLQVGGLREVVGRKDQQLCEKDESLRKYLHLAAMINRMTTAPLDDSTGATGLGSSGGSRGEAMMMMEGGGETQGRL